MYKLNSLSDAVVVESADKIMNPLLKDYTIREVEVNSIGAVIYSVFLTANRKFESLEDILSLCKPIGGTNRKASITVHNGLILFKFFRINSDKDIWINILQNGENGVEGFLA